MILLSGLSGLLSAGHNETCMGYSSVHQGETTQRESCRVAQLDAHRAAILVMGRFAAAADILHVE